MEWNGWGGVGFGRGRCMRDGRMVGGAWVEMGGGEDYIPHGRQRRLRSRRRFLWLLGGWLVGLIGVKKVSISLWVLGGAGVVRCVWFGPDKAIGR